MSRESTRADLQARVQSVDGRHAPGGHDCRDDAVDNPAFQQTVGKRFAHVEGLKWPIGAF
ncbi:hypothetical protein D3C83_35310 [compost metagenome]